MFRFSTTGIGQPVDMRSHRQVSEPRDHMAYFYPVGAFFTSILSSAHDGTVYGFSGLPQQVLHHNLVLAMMLT